MSIEKHEWSDSGIATYHYDDGQIAIRITESAEDLALIYKKDAIAKHFNVDNESLVEGIKILVDFDGCGLSRGELIRYLQKLITKEGIEE